MHPAIAQHRSDIADICRRFRISTLEVFGSAASAVHFDPERSDADFLVEFERGVRPTLETLYGLQAALEELLARNVDLLEPAAVRNPYLLASINRHRETIYAAA